MNEQPPPNPEQPATEPVSPGPVTGLGTATTVQPMPAQARWARIGLLGIGAAALIAVAALAFGSTASPTGTLAAGSNGTGSTSTSSGVTDLHGGPGGRGGPG